MIVHPTTSPEVLDADAHGGAEDVLVVRWSDGSEIVVTEGLALRSWVTTRRAWSVPIGDA